jgi:hypothetical protein
VPVSPFWISALAAVGILQLLSAATAFHWALPLFSDPPFLGTLLRREHYLLKGLLAGNPAAVEPLATLLEKLWWLFNHHRQGVNLAMGLGLALALSGGFSLTATFVGLGRLRSGRT